MVAERERVSRLTHKNQHAQGVPPSPYRNGGGTNEFATKKSDFLMCLCVNGLLKPTDNVDQQAKDNWHGINSQVTASRLIHSSY